MKLCMPVKTDSGLQAELESHLPHAALLLVFDTTTRQCQVGEVGQPIVADALLCGSINRRLLRSLLDQGVQVYGTDAQTVEEAVGQFERGELEPVGAIGCGQHEGQAGESHECCGGHRHGHGHDEGHECCGGHRHGHDDDHECCGGRGHGDDHECCGGQGHGHRHRSGGCGCGAQA